MNGRTAVTITEKEKKVLNHSLNIQSQKYFSLITITQSVTITGARVINVNP